MNTMPEFQQPRDDDAPFGLRPLYDENYNIIRPRWSNGDPVDDAGFLSSLLAITAPLGEDWAGHTGADNGPLGCKLFCYKLKDNETATETAVMGPTWNGSPRDSQGDEAFATFEGGEELLEELKERYFCGVSPSLDGAAARATADTLLRSKPATLPFKYEVYHMHSTFSCGVGVRTEGGYIVGFECSPVFWT